MKKTAQRRFEIGDIVRYDDINLIEYIGVVKDIGKFERGADLIVEWRGKGIKDVIKTGEYYFNLVLCKCPSCEDSHIKKKYNIWSKLSGFHCEKCGWKREFED